MARPLLFLWCEMDKSNLPIGKPCDVDFSKMKPADRGRFCADCKKVVHELAQLTEAEAQELFSSAKKGELCVRYVYDAHGKVFFADTPRSVIPAGLLVRAKRVATVAAALAAPLTLAACGIGGTMQGDLVGYTGNGVIAEGADAEADAAADADAAAPDAKDDAHDDAAADGGADSSDDDAASDASADNYVPPN
jgi:hypothetical protein